jgi:signal transduction histidine kinase
MGASAKRMLRRNQNEEELKILENIYDSSTRLTRWIDDTLFSSNPSSQEKKDEMKEIDIQPLIQQAIDLLKEAYRDKSIEICFEASSSLPPVICREQLLSRAIENVLSNAFKYTPNGGKVEVSVNPYRLKEDTEVIEILVKDTGIGISEEDRGKIFEPFYRGKNGLLEDGAGLGLSLVKEVVDLHGGKILVHSEPNKGSTFAILLPVKQEFKRDKEVARQYEMKKVSLEP